MAAAAGMKAMFDMVDNDQVAPSAGLVTAVLLLTVASGVAYTLGWRFRWTGPVFAVSLLVVLSYRNGWGHLFHNDKREFYGLENLWSDAKRLEVEGI